MEDTNLAPHIDEIKRALQDKLSGQDIEKELKRYFDLGIDVRVAKQSIIKKYGGSPEFAPAVQRTLAQLGQSDPNVHVKGKVVRVDSKVVTVRGEERSIREGFLSDESGTVPFTSWIDLEISDGDILDIKGGYTRTFRGGVQLNIGNRATVAKLPADPLFKVSDAPPAASIVQPREMKLAEVASQTGAVTITGKILDVQKKEVMVRGEARTVHSGTIADGTGRVAFSAWDDFQLKVGEAVKITGAFVKPWRGIPQLSFDSRSRVERIDAGALSAIDASTASAMQIDQITKIGGAFDVSVEAVVVGIKESSGIVSRCPQCRRVVTQGACVQHGAVEGVPDMRVKAIIDDGTGSMMAVLNAEATSAVLGRTLNEAQELARSDLQEDAVMKELRAKLMGRPVTIRGNVATDEFGPMMIGSQAKVVKHDIRSEAAALLAGMGVQ